MKKQEPTIRTSNHKCSAIPCAKSGFILKSDHRDLSIPLCIDHVGPKLAEWEAEDKAEEQRRKQIKDAEKAKKDASNAAAMPQQVPGGPVVPIQKS